MQSRRILLVALVVALCITPLFFLLSDARTQETLAPSTESVPVADMSEASVTKQKSAEAEPAAVPTPARTHAFVADAAGTLESMMQERRAEGSFMYTSRLYPTLGSFVESIDGLENEGGSYWMLYINGSLSSSGMSQAEVERGDRIEWRYE